MKKKLKLKFNKDRNWGSAFTTIPGWNPEKLKNAKVMVVGAGALGNEVVKNLTLLNVGHIVIIDFDIIEYNNLAKSILFRKEDMGAKKAHAMANNLKAINDEVKVLPILGDISTDVGLGVFRRMDVVIGCLDNRYARLYINRHCHKVNKTWVDGALENLSGQFNVYTPGKSCYECSLTDDAWRIIKFRMGCPDIAKRNASLGVIATTPISSSIIGGFQTQEALKIIFGDNGNSMAGEGFHYDGVNNFFLKYKEVDLKEECTSHYEYNDIIEATDLSHTNTVKEVLDWMESHFETNEFSIQLEEDIVLEVKTSKHGKVCTTAIYKNHLLEAEEIIELEREFDEDLAIQKFTNSIDQSFPFQDKTLEEIGIPFLEILRVEAKKRLYYIELTGDEKKLIFK